MISRRLERFSLKRADLITFASQPMLAKLSRLFPELPLESKGLLMMNGYAGEPCPVRVASDSVDLRIGYFGMADDDEKGYRNIEPLFRAIAGAIKTGIAIRLCFYGCASTARCACPALISRTFLLLKQTLPWRMTRCSLLCRECTIF